MATLAANTLIHAHIQIARAHLKLGMHFEVTCACLTDSNESLDDAELEDDSLIPEPEDVSKVIEQNRTEIGICLIKVGELFPCTSLSC